MKKRNDYLTAKAAIDFLQKEENKEVEVEVKNKPAFRKYLSDLAQKKGIRLTTRSIKVDLLKIFKL